MLFLVSAVTTSPLLSVVTILFDLEASAVDLRRTELPVTYILLDVVEAVAVGVAVLLPPVKKFFTEVTALLAVDFIVSHTPSI